jgi:diacylglycerol kinase (ATP)
MRAAAIVGPGNLSKHVAAFQQATGTEWTSLIEQADAVVIFGGDGTVHHQLSTLVDLDVPLLVVPCGSGNDFARALGLRSTPDSIAAWNKFARGSNRAHAIDLGVIRSLAKSTSARVFPSGRSLRAESSAYFCCVAGVGLDTRIAARANKLPRWLRSRGGYFWCAPSEFMKFSPTPMRISCNGTQGSSRPTILAAVANAPAYGGGMRIAPRAKLDDGMLDLCRVGAMDVLKLFCLFPTVYLGRHLGFREVEYSQAPEVRIETEHPIDVYADGEYVCQTPVEFGIARNALNVIMAS